VLSNFIAAVALKDYLCQKSKTVFPVTQPTDFEIMQQIRKK